MLGVGHPGTAWTLNELLVCPACDWVPSSESDSHNPFIPAKKVLRKCLPDE